MALLLKNFLLCDGGMETARYGSLMVEGGKIAAIGAPDWNPPAAETVDGGGKAALLPGFVNAHTHAAMSLLRGIGEEAPLMEWLKEKIWPAEAKLREEHVYWGTMLALLEMAANGITAFGDMYFFMDSVVEASLEMGMKCTAGRGIVGPEQVKLEEGLRLAEAWKGREEFVTVQLAPHAPYTVPMHFLKEIVAAAKDRNLGIHFHFLEAEWETGYLRDEMKMSPAEYLREAGLPEVRQAVLAHCVWLDPAVLDEVDFSRMTIVHNPNSNQKLGSGMMNLPGMMEKTRKIALGTDGAASNNRLDVWGEMRSAALVSKGIAKDPTVIPARDVLRMATFEGAEALGFEKKGMIREGWAADFVMVDLDRPEYVGIDGENASHFFVYAGSSADVTGTMVAGKWLYRDGRFPGTDAEKILAKAKEMRDNLLKG
ncbi:amidohydrolase [Aminivibrio sp.]|uniref:amidohydrolase n=1 Tax=Aminivibrio sp. TaxID=1872489 RepID=UPI001A3E340A|nr:amidohydrolase [Aminivibrio sp.]MBL3539309.1 amidohydrolase [Aminivibrio sp.]